MVQSALKHQLRTYRRLLPSRSESQPNTEPQGEDKARRRSGRRRQVMVSAQSTTESMGSAQRAVGTAGSMFVRVPQAHGVRRRREEAVEIEELDSHTMRQSSYNYFQRHGQAQSAAATAASVSGPALLRTSTFRSSLGRSPASRKRQRTLAEQLDELCLQGTRGRASGIGAGSSARSRSRSHSRGRKRSSRRHAERSSRIVELDELGREKQSSVDSSASGSDSDGMADVARSTERGVRVYGDMSSSVGLRGFFAAGASARHRPMDRMYRHYVAIAAANAASQSHGPQGNELVVFRAPSSSPDTPGCSQTGFMDDLPAYLSLTPREFEKLSLVEKRQWYQTHSRYMRQLDEATAEHKSVSGGDDQQCQLEAKATAPSLPSSRRRSSSESSGRSFQLMGVPSTDEAETDELEDEDVEMMEDVEDLVAPPKQPHPAGAISHTEWFADEL